MIAAVNAPPTNPVASDSFKDQKDAYISQMVKVKSDTADAMRVANQAYSTYEHDPEEAKQNLKDGIALFDKQLDALKKIKPPNQPEPKDGMDKYLNIKQFHETY
jgi:hypothetical protein